MIPALERISARYNNWADDYEMCSITPKELRRAILSAYNVGLKASKKGAGQEKP